MPIHDWTRVDPSLFRSFWIGWLAALNRALATALPAGYYPLVGRNGLPVRDEVPVTVPTPRDCSYLGVRREADDRLAAVVALTAPGADLRGVIGRGVHVLALDLYPGAVPSSVTSHEAAGPNTRATVEVLTAGGPLPDDAPLFLRPGWHVLVPLERTYTAAWNHFPAPVRRLVDPGP